MSALLIETETQTCLDMHPIYLGVSVLCSHESFYKVYKHY